MSVAEHLILIAAAADGGTATDAETKNTVRKLPPYRVILHNDDVNSIDHVVQTILKLTPLKELEAVERTLEAHQSGQSVLLTTTKERAELYVEQFASCRLTVTAEPDA